MLFADHRQMIEFIRAQVPTSFAAFDPADGCRIDLPGFGIGRKIGRVHRAGFELLREVQQQLGNIPDRAGTK
jgi:hypothetical protein